MSKHLAGEGFGDRAQPQDRVAVRCRAALAGPLAETFHGGLSVANGADDDRGHLGIEDEHLPGEVDDLVEQGVRAGGCNARRNASRDGRDYQRSSPEDAQYSGGHWALLPHCAIERDYARCDTRRPDPVAARSALVTPSLRSSNRNTRACVIPSAAPPAPRAVAPGRPSARANTTRRSARSRSQASGGELGDAGRCDSKFTSPDRPRFRRAALGAGLDAQTHVAQGSPPAMLQHACWSTPHRRPVASVTPCERP